MDCAAHFSQGTERTHQNCVERAQTVVAALNPGLLSRAQALAVVLITSLAPESEPSERAFFWPVTRRYLPYIPVSHDVYPLHTKNDDMSVYANLAHLICSTGLPSTAFLSNKSYDTSSGLYTLDWVLEERANGERMRQQPI